MKLEYGQNCFCTNIPRQIGENMRIDEVLNPEPAKLAPCLILDMQQAGHSVRAGCIKARKKPHQLLIS